MPTFNQLVRKGRQTAVKKSTAPALQKTYNSLRKKAVDQAAPQKRGVCTAVKTEEARKGIQLADELSDMILFHTRVCENGKKMEQPWEYK